MGFGKERVYRRNLDQYPHTVDNVILPANTIQRDWINVSVKEDGEPDGQLLNGNALRTLLVREHLDLQYSYAISRPFPSNNRK